MTAEVPESFGRRSRVCAGAVFTGVAVAGITAPAAHADGFAEAFSDSVAGAINGPWLLALPIVAGVFVASIIAALIYWSAQPREDDF